MNPTIKALPFDFVPRTVDNTGEKNFNTDNILVYDIETDSLDTTKANIKAIGCYSFRDKKYYIIPYNKLYFAKQLFADHKILVSYNGEYYDDPILERHGFDFTYKVRCDILKAVKKRVTIIKTDKGLLADVLMNFTLDATSKALGIVDDSTGKIKDFDYGILSKAEWSEKEYQELCDYTMRDLEVTTKLWMWLENYFIPFAEYITIEDARRKKYITCSAAAFAYKSICKETGLPEVYDEVEQSNEPTFEGAYVAYPPGEHFSGTLHVLDFSSLYPSVFLQNNLFSPVEEGKGWHGDDVIKTVGTYNNEKRGKIEELFVKWYNLRQEYKKQKDKREYCLKIILNSSYGASSSQTFKSIYNKTGASDCTFISRQFILFARKKFREAGYKLLMTDTDSVCLLDPFNDKERVLKTKNEMIAELKKHVPFPFEKFDMAYENTLTDAWFFKGSTKTSKEDADEFMDEDDINNKPLGYMKKNYILRTVEGKVIVKNLSVRKKSTSALTRKIFWDIIVPRISQERRVKFPRSYFKELIDRLLLEDISLAAIRYSVKEASTYKSQSQLQAQIATKYGAGIHFIIPNRTVGVGKDKRYASIDDFKKAGLTIRDINLDNVWQELNYFIEQEESPLKYTKQTKLCFTGVKMDRKPLDGFPKEGTNIVVR